MLLEDVFMSLEKMASALDLDLMELGSLTAVGRGSPFVRVAYHRLQVLAAIEIENIDIYLFQ